MVEIRVSDDVRDVLGAEGVRRAAALLHAGVRCAICNQQVPPTGPATVLVARGGGQFHVSYAHPDCGDSTVVDLPAAAMDAVMPDVLDMGVTALVIEQGGQLLPALVAETPTGVPLMADARGDQPGELASVMTTTLLGQGFSLVVDLDELPARAGGWRVAARSAGPDALHLEITGRRGLLFYKGTADPPGPWVMLAEAARWCPLYAAAEPVHWPDAAEPAGTLAALHAAAATGGLVAARVPIIWRP